MLAAQAEGRNVITVEGIADGENLHAVQQAMVDAVEVGRDASPPVRVAFEVRDVEAVTASLVAAGASLLGGPVVTPWRSRNTRLDAPAGLPLTLFEELEPLEERRRRPGFTTGGS